MEQRSSSEVIIRPRRPQIVGYSLNGPGAYIVLALITVAIVGFYFLVRYTHG